MKNLDIEKVVISFYGGEPLLKVNNIIKFMECANNLVSKYENKTIIYHMTTNGYLLVPNVYNKLVALGLRTFQISLDGFAEQHNKTRPRVDGAGTWDKIVENLKYINTVEDNAHIILRTNCSPINISIIKEYDKWSREIFTNKKFEIQYEPVSMFSSMVDENLVIDTSNPVCYELYKLAKQNEAGINYPNEFRKPGWRCEYANGNNFTISTSGKVYCCEDCDNDKTCIGYLDKNGEIVYNHNIREVFTRFEKEACKTCIVYPICYAQSCLNEDKCQSVLDDLKRRIEDIQAGKFIL